MNTDCRTMKSAMLQKNDVYPEDLFSPRDHGICLSEDKVLLVSRIIFISDMFLSFIIFSTFMSANVMALTFDPDFLTVTGYDLQSSRYTTMSFGGDTLMYFYRTMIFDLEENMKDFSDYSYYYISYNSKY